MNIIIIAKTHMKNGSCVGALADNGKFLRLLDEDGHNQPINTDFEVRQIWGIEFKERNYMRPPHIEDVLVTSKKLKGTLKEEITMLEIVEKFNIPIWHGNPDALFDGKLNWTHNGSGYINEENGIPNNSVGFWIPDMNLTKRISPFDKIQYSYPNIDWRNFPYVGYSNSVDTILAGTLVRVSLARWWSKDQNTAEACYLQLSGWYD